MCAFNDSVLEAAREFHGRARLPLPRAEGPVVEVAHQPLFLPSPGFFEKIAFGCWLAQRRGGVCAFGFVDDDYALFPSMWSARLPARNKNGYEKIGFAVEPQRKSFFVLPKPSLEEANAAAEKTGFGFLVDCWNKSDSLSDFNALTAAKICGLLGLNALFFEYSRLPSAALDKQLTFFDEHQREFVSAFNASLRKRRLAGAKPMAENELPLWRVERDGTKKQLLVGEKAAQGERIAFKAVARNIAFASLLGSGVYVSGGGALSEERGYAGVAHDVAQALGAVEPETVVWRNKDVYRSSEARETRDLNGLEKQVSELKALLRAAKEKESAFLAETRGSESENKSKNAGLEADFETRRQTLFEEKKRAEREFQKKQVKFLEVKRAAKTENSIFSIADLLRVVDAGRVKREWFASLDAAKPARKEFYLEYATMTRFF